MLEEYFSLEEIKAAIWDNERYKSPDPNGYNFGFIKNVGILWKET